MSDLAEQIEAFLAINATGKVSHPTSGLAVELLEKALQHLRLQSLSTQQPMGEPVAWAREVDINGPCLILPCFLRWADVAMFKSQRGNKDAVFRPLYALHPNQESGE